MPQYTELLGLSIQQLTEVAEGLAEAPYRARQLFDGLYRQRWQTAGQFTPCRKPSASSSRVRISGWVAPGRKEVCLRRRYRALPVGVLRRPERRNRLDARRRRRRSGRRLRKRRRGTRRVIMPSCSGMTSVIPSEVERSLARRRHMSIPRYNDRGSLASRHHLRLQPGGLRRRVRLLHDGPAWTQRNLTAGEIVGQILTVLNDQQAELQRDRSTSSSWDKANLS